MKMKAMKKLLAMFMALSLVFALAACGDNGGDNTQTPSQAGAESAAPAGSEEPAASEGGATGDYGDFADAPHRARQAHHGDQRLLPPL